MAQCKTCVILAFHYYFRGLITLTRRSLLYFIHAFRSALCWPSVTRLHGNALFHMSQPFSVRLRKKSVEQQTWTVLFFFRFPLRAPERVRQSGGMCVPARAPPPGESCPSGARLEVRRRLAAGSNSLFSHQSRPIKQRYWIKPI